MVDFVAIKPGVTLNRGDVIREDQIARLSIPASAVGNLREFAVLYSGPANRHWAAGVAGEARRLAAVDRRLAHAAAGVGIGENSGPDGEEVGLSIPVGGAMVTSLFDPGDLVSFVTSTTRYNRPTPAAKPADPDKDPKTAKAGSGH